jgi:valyl-tRNA synthetase
MEQTVLPKAYEPQEVEARWYDYWEKGGFFRADANGRGPAFSMVIPPPNVTGTLHMGHALNNTLQDILARYKRMQGFNVLWMPGTDHAGIATQNVVERALAQEGTDRHQLGREAFVGKVWEWRQKYGHLIIHQLKRLGASCDWTRERFTMDEGLSRAVREVFVRLYREGLIYKGDYIINWCPRCLTALSDLEVEHEPHEGSLYHIKYPLKDQKGHLVVATTRPETLLGDTAVAVNPEDKRYRKFHGEKVILPLMDREIPVIADSYVDQNFGTGALKITPAHDFADFELAQRHDLPAIRVMDDQGIMNREAGPYQGLDRMACREKVLKDLKKKGLLKKVEPYHLHIGHCYRCKTLVEPYLSKQWFVRVKSLAEPAIRMVEEGKTRILPAQWERTYYDWMNNIRDWCISRQIWWGHRIPAWTCRDCDQIVVAAEEPRACPQCQSALLEQETDVLDTWFSSALWPFSTLGWPDKTGELGVFYPTSVLVTGFDILFFWVARMMMMGIHFMEEVPFKDVYIHALVRDAEGQKMSKSKGNVIDPLEVMNVYGTDAFRFTLTAFAAQGRDVKLSEERIAGYRHFVNKIWNAARLAFMHLPEDRKTPLTLPNPKEVNTAERWIMSRLNQVIGGVEEALEGYHFNEAANLLYQFIWHEYCDWYLEWIKPTLAGESGDTPQKNARAILSYLLEAILKMIHPIMPFVSEELWQKGFGGEGKSLMQCAFPKPQPAWDSPEAEETVRVLMGVVSQIRNIRGEMNVPPSKSIQILVYGEKEPMLAMVRNHEPYILQLVKGEGITYPAGKGAPKFAATGIFEDLEIYVPLKGLLNLEEEEERLNKELQKLKQELGILNKKMSNEDFLKKAPPKVVEKEKEKVGLIQTKAEKIQDHLVRLKQLRG